MIISKVRIKLRKDLIDVIKSNGELLHIDTDPMFVIYKSNVDIRKFVKIH